MPRRVQDIRPAERRSIRDIEINTEESAKATRVKKSLPESSRRGAKAIKVPGIKKTSTAEELEVTEVEGEEVVPIHKPSANVFQRMPITPPTMIRRPSRRIGLWFTIGFGLVVLIIGAAYIASVKYSKASFTIIPKVIPLNLNGTYVASANQNDTSITYELVTVKDSATLTVPASSGPQTSTKASGKVTFYNTSSNQTIRLIAGTRLSSEKGLIYRLSSSIVIPGYTKPAGTIVPGKINAGIVADQAGQNYNLDQSELNGDFKIVAYKGTNKYETIYAKPLSAITGGFVGVKKIVSPSVLASTTASLKSQLTTSLLQKLKGMVPAGSIMYDGSYVSQFSAAEIGGTEKNAATVTIQATLYGIAFKQNKLIETLAGNQSTTLFGQFKYTAPGLEELQVNITNLKDYSPSKKGTLVLRVKGAMRLLGTVPVDEIKTKLAGISLAETQNIFKLYGPVIESGSGELAPPWAKIPTDLSRITVTVKESL